MKVITLVKAAPVLTRSLEETMCVAGVRVDAATPHWVRLHPVPFRDLDNDQRFAKYQSVSVKVQRPRGDRRPESWTPVHGTIRPGESISAANGWAQRRQLVDQLGEADMCELIEMNHAGSGPGVRSLAVVRPLEPPQLTISARDEKQLREWRRRAEGAASRISLFDDPTTRKPAFEVVPWRFRYSYRCRAKSCPGHSQTIVDWEVLALWRHVHRRVEWRDLIRHKFEDTLWRDRESALFVGNQEQYPISFLVLGVFWPPSGPAQGSLPL